MSRRDFRKFDFPRRFLSRAIRSSELTSPVSQAPREFANSFLAHTDVSDATAPKCDGSLSI